MIVTLLEYSRHTAIGPPRKLGRQDSMENDRNRGVPLKHHSTSVSEYCIEINPLRKIQNIMRAPTLHSLTILMYIHFTQKLCPIYRDTPPNRANTYILNSNPAQPISINRCRRASSNQINYKRYQSKIHTTHHTRSLKSLIHPLTHFHSSQTIARTHVCAF